MPGASSNSIPSIRLTQAGLPLGDLYLLRSVPELEPHVEELPSQVHLVGACAWGLSSHTREQKLVAALSEARTQGTPVVYVQQGRTFWRPAFWQIFLRAARTLPYLFVASTGRLDAEAVTAEPCPANVVALPHAEQEILLPESAAVICSGNSAAMLGAATHGVPTLAIPSGGEQRDVAACFEAANMSITIPVDHLTEETLKDALHALVRQTRYRMPRHEQKRPSTALRKSSEAPPYWNISLLGENVLHARTKRRRITDPKPTIPRPFWRTCGAREHFFVRLDPAAHGIDAVADRILDRLPVRHAAREIGKLDQVAAALTRPPT